MGQCMVEEKVGWRIEVGAVQWIITRKNFSGAGAAYQASTVQ